MSKKKDNFNEAVYSMFGVGKAPAVEKAAEPAVEETTGGSVDELLAEYVSEPDEASVAEPAEETKEEPKMGLTRIAEGTSVEGKLISKGDVEVAGSFKGDINAKGTVTICSDFQGNITASELCIRSCIITGDVNVSGSVFLSENATVVGNVTAGEFICCGIVQGDLDIVGNLTLKEKAQIEGNVAMGTLMVEQGAVIAGSMNSKKKGGK